MHGEPPTTIEWELSVSDDDLLHLVAYVFPSVLGGLVVLAGGLLAVVVGRAVLAGRPSEALAIVLVGVLGLLARPYLPVLLGSQLPDPFRARYSRRGLAAGSVLAAGLLIGSARLHPDAPFVLFVGSWVPLVLTAGFPTSGRVDPGAGTAVVDGSELPLGSLRRVRGRRLGAVVVCWLSYRRGEPFAPRVVVVPPAAYRALGTVAGDEQYDDAEGSADLTVRTVAALLGLGMLALGPALFLLLPPGDARVVAVMAAALFGLFGAALCWYALRG